MGLMALRSKQLRSVSFVTILTLCFAGCQKRESTSIELVGFPDSLRPAVDPVAAVFQRRPDDASVLYQVAALHAFAGHTDAALATLRRMADLSSGVDPRVRDGFGSIAENAEFKAIQERIRREFPPVNRAERVFDVPAGVGIPEGVAWSARTRLLYMGGFRTITAVDSSGQTRTFVAPGATRLGGVVGIRVDDRRGEFWATSSKFGNPPPDAVIGLFRFRLADGQLLATYPISDSALGFVNDIAIASDGSAYATATNTGALFRVDSAGNSETFLPRGTLPDPNGIAASEDGQYLFVAGWYGIVRVDLKTRDTLMLRQASNVASGCLDGLYLTAPRELVGVQNCVHATGRILRFGLSATRDSIEHVEVLESYNPLFDGITTAAVAGPVLYFVANTQLRKIGRDGQVTDPLDPLHVLRLPLLDR
jgi:sugar lactone lactonase YvrE